MKRILKFIKKLTETPAFRKVNATLVDVLPNACKSLWDGGDFFEDDKLLECIIKYRTVPMHHQIGTCRLGKNKKDDCVDEDLKIHGVQNLRVIDSSVIRRSTSGHTIPVVIMMAEAIADLIKETCEDD